MSTATQLAQRTIHDLAPGRPATSSTAVVLPMTRGTGPRARVDAGGTRLRLRALHVMGHGSARIARALGVREMTILALVRGDTTDHQPASCATRSPTSTTPGGTSAPPNAPAPNAPPPPPPAAAPSPATGAPPPPSTTTSSTPPATAPAAAGAPPPAPAPPPTSTPRRHHRQEARMTDQRMNPDLIHDVLDVLDRHGYTRADDEHTGRAILLISDLAHIYEGAQDHPFGPYINQASPSQTATSAVRTGRPGRRHRPSRPGQDPPGRPGHRRRRQTRPRRRPAPTAPASPAPPASRVSSTPGPTTASPLT